MGMNSIPVFARDSCFAGAGRAERIGHGKDSGESCIVAGEARPAALIQEFSTAVLAQNDEVEQRWMAVFICTWSRMRPAKP